MELKKPFFISARLMPALNIAGATLSLDSESRNAEGRTQYKCFIDLPDGSEHEITGLRSGCQGGSVQEGFQSLLSFLSAAGESFNRNGIEGENSDLFPQPVTQWASENMNGLDYMEFDIAETNLIN